MKNGVMRGALRIAIGLGWLLVACGCDEGDRGTGPVEHQLEVWEESWENGKKKLEYQYYLDADGVAVRHGYYREYSRFVDGLRTVDGAYSEGMETGEWRQRCRSGPLPYPFENGDFETGDFTGWRLEGARGNSIGLVDEGSAAGGRYAARLTLYPGDRIRGGNRVELVRLDPGNVGTERIYLWRFKIDADYGEEPYWQALCQFHSQPDTLNGETWDTYPEFRPSISILYAGQNCRAMLIPPDQVPIEMGRFAVEKGVWFEVFFQVGWSLEEDGYVEMYVDGKPVTPFNGVDHKYYSANANNQAGNYLTIGLYRDLRATRVNTVYVDEVEISACVR